MSIPFDRIASDLLARAPDLLASWLPGGKRVGNEYKCGSIQGGKGDSCSTNLTTGLGADFATGQKWGDLVDLYAQIHGLGMGDAAKQLAPHLVNGYDTRAPRDTTAPRPALTAPPPAAAAATIPAVTPPTAPPDVPDAAALYRYTDTFYIARFERSDGTKSFNPFTWDGEKWQRKAAPKPRPLYGLDDLAARPNATVLAVEGEKARDAAAGAYRSTVVVTWAGGAQAVDTADWEPLRGRKVKIWPDADEPGRAAAIAISEQLARHCPDLAVVNTADAPADGWDIADAIADGWDAKRLTAWANERMVEVKPPDPAKVPRETKRPRKPAGSEPTASGAPAYVLWEQLQLARNERGPYATEANALRIIAAHGSYAGRIWLDEFSQRLMIDDPDADHGCRLFSRTDALAMLVWMQESLQLPKMPLSAVERAAVLVGERNKRHPLRDWLDGLLWDSCVRLPALLADGWGVEQSEYSAAVGRCWFTALVARVMDPGCKADNVMVFEGAQGMTKSTALSIIGDRWFLETTKNPVRDPDKFLQALQGKWLVEIPEIDRIGGRSGDLSDLTGLITITTDTYRMPYAPTAMDYPRQCIFTGTANRSSNWQPDETGGRRYWPVVCREINLDYLRANREQLFAEAVHRYRAGESWWDVPAEEASEQQETRRITDEWEGIIERFMNEYPDRRDWQAGVIWYPRTKPLEFVTVASVLEDALGLPESKWDMGSQKRVAKCMTPLGLTKQRPTIDGKRVWVYAKPNTFTGGT